MTTTATASDAAPATTRPSRPGLARHGGTRLLGWLLAAAVLVLLLVVSLAVGARSIGPAAVIDALRGLNPDPVETAVVLQGRLPRTVIGLVAGIGLGLSGALIQAVSRNPLADPGILGVNAGSAFALALGVGVLGVGDPRGYLWFAFGGALAATVVVALIGSAGRQGSSPVRLTLAGVALGAVLAGITSAMRLADPRTFQAMTAWESGSLADRGWSGVTALLPFMVVGVAVAALLGPALNAVALGDDLAASLGANVLLVRVGAVLAITVLAGGATAIAGPVAFVGLMVPHVARWVVGPDQRWILAYTLLLAPSLLLAADVVGRVALPTGELPAGIVTACLGAPVLILLVRRQRASGL